MRLDSTLKGFDYHKDGEGENKNCKNYTKAKTLPWQLALNASKAVTRALTCSICGKEGWTMEPQFISIYFAYWIKQKNI